MDEIPRYQITYSAAAIQDIEEKSDYLIQQFRDPVVAERWYERLRNEIQKQLSTMPNKYPAYSVEPWNTKGIRFFDSRNDVILYSVDAKRKMVYIHSVCTKGRDIASHLESNTM